MNSDTVKENSEGLRNIATCTLRSMQTTNEVDVCKIRAVIQMTRGFGIEVNLTADACIKNLFAESMNLFSMIVFVTNQKKIVCVISSIRFKN